ncbi:NUDIX hydrolase [Pseudonocardia nantongensis]|uniref:NUDIX hydrolase n=1 Tax=Pseudonocardia nantongensis TaxID=1181885 RepID=UPI0039781320
MSPAAVVSSVAGGPGAGLLVALVLVVLVAAALTAWCLSRVRRLDRLHARVDAARAGLGAALDHRAEVALRVAAVLDPGPGERVRSAARTALAGTAPAPDGRDPAGTRERRETAENALTRELAVVDAVRATAVPGAELTEAHERVVLARRVHNDAVRDTRVLRSRRLVRLFHLYGTAPEPVYFEIADPPSTRVPGGPDRSVRGGTDTDVESTPSPNAM